jgi:hypothetical protein
MRHNHNGFDTAAIADKKTWTRPLMTSVRLTPAELKEAGATRESVGAFGRKLIAQGRL